MPTESANPVLFKNEKARIAVLKSYRILDTPPEKCFDQITGLTAKLFKVPVAAISFVDADRIWFKSTFGLPGIKQVEKEAGLCATAIMSGKIYQIKDALMDSRCFTNSLVTSEFGLRFYGGAPLIDKNGFILGTLCIIDHKPREISASQEEMFKDLAAMVVEQMTKRINTLKDNKKYSKILEIAAHDMKSPIIGISYMSELIQNRLEEPEKYAHSIREMATLIKKSTTVLISFIDDFLKATLIDAGRIKLQKRRLNLGKIAKEVVDANLARANNKNQQLHFKINDNPIITGDKKRIWEIFDNLINNAIKFSGKEKSIWVVVKKTSTKAVFKVKDEGPGLTEIDKKKVFGKFARLTARPTGGESSTGLGLSIVKMLVNLHNGTVYVESFGKNKGCTFIVEFNLN